MNCQRHIEDAAAHKTNLRLDAAWRDVWEAAILENVLSGSASLRRALASLSVPLGGSNNSFALLSASRL